MNEGCRRLARALRASSIFLYLPFAVFLTACGSDGQQATTVSVASVASTTDSDAAAPAGSGTSTSAVVQLSPSFSVLIHDYVIQCASSPSIDLTIHSGQFALTGVLDTSGAAVQSASSTGGTFEQTMSMLPGQRFQFTLADQSDSYSVRCLPANFPTLSVSLASGTQTVSILENGQSPEPEGQWYIFAPTVGLTTTSPSSYVIITDVHGTPVWWQNEPLGPAIDAKVLSATQIAWSVQANGNYFIRDFSGNLLNTLTGGLDFHDLQTTPSGTFLVIKYVPRICPPDCADMSPWGGSSASAVIDAEILELDSASNVLWTWRSRDHIALRETGEETWFPGIGTDIIHMNALQPDGADAVIFSARHLNAIYHITKSTGAIDWKIGGAAIPESFTVIGDTRPTALGPTGQVLNGQHDVRKWSDDTVSVHDNGTMADRSPFVVRYQIDTASKTANVVEEFSDSRVTTSACCGSARRLPNGHWVVNWGAESFFTELATVGTTGIPVLTVQYSTNGIFSYRSIPVATGLISANTLRNGMDAMAPAP